MKKWDATMPKARAGVGKAHVVLAFRKSDGGRQEFTGELDSADAQALMTQALRMATQAAKEQK